MGVKRAGGLVGQHDLRIVDERAGDGDALHLTARKLARLLVQMLGQPDRCQGLLGAALHVEKAAGDDGRRLGEDIVHWTSSSL